jgi:hypothetical protein
MANGPKSRKVVGSEQRADAPAADVQQLWKTDVLEGTDPNFRYQFMREEEVRDRGRSRMVLDRRTGEQVRVDGWTVCTEDEVGVSRERPDLANPVDGTMRMGSHVLMKIPAPHWELLQHEKDAVPDALEHRLLSGAKPKGAAGIPDFRNADVAEDFSEGGTRVVGKQAFFAPHPALMGGFQGG